MKQAIKIFAPIFLSLVFFQTYAFSQITDLENPCKNLSKIESIPYKPSDVNQTEPMYKEYFDIVNKGESAIPCLIENITNNAEMDDPNCPGVGVVAVGDVAYFILQDIGKFDFTSMFSSEIQKAYKTDGIYGYYRLIDENENRSKLQTKVKEWYSSRIQAKK